jgi:hypothetical protein
VKNILLVVIIFLFAGCAAQNVEISSFNNYNDYPRYKQSQHFFFFGVGQYSSVNALQICGGRSVSMVRTEYEPTDLLFAILTAGIYTPRTVSIYCK